MTANHDMLSLEDKRVFYKGVLYAVWFHSSPRRYSHAC
jgi:hypothetical protein